MLSANADRPWLALVLQTPARKKRPDDRRVAGGSVVSPDRQGGSVRADDRRGPVDAPAQAWRSWRARKSLSSPLPCRRPHRYGLGADLTPGGELKASAAPGEGTLVVRSGAPHVKRQWKVIETWRARREGSQSAAADGRFAAHSGRRTAAGLDRANITIFAYTRLMPATVVAHQSR